MLLNFKDTNMLTLFFVTAILYYIEVFYSSTDIYIKSKDSFFFTLYLSTLVSR